MSKSKQKRVVKWKKN